MEVDRMNLIEACDLSFSYQDHTVFKNVSFEIQEGDFIGIIGPNGGGKTTLIKIFLGLLKNYQGKIKIFGKPPGKFPHRIAYLPQYMQFDEKIPITVEEVVLMGCLGHSFWGPYTKRDRKKVAEAMEAVNVYQYHQKQFSSLSGGEKQRVLMARALTCHPELMILDEPSAGIDNYNEQILLDILKELDKKMTILMVSHHYHLVSQLVNKVLCVHENKVDVHWPLKIDDKLFKDLISSKYQYIEHHHNGEK